MIHVSGQGKMNDLFYLFFLVIFPTPSRKKRRLQRGGNAADTMKISAMLVPLWLDTKVSCASLYVMVPKSRSAAISLPLFQLGDELLLAGTRLRRWLRAISEDRWGARSTTAKRTRKSFDGNSNQKFKIVTSTLISLNECSVGSEIHDVVTALDSVAPGNT